MDPTSNIGRWVTFLLAPVAGFIALKANQWFGFELSPAEIISFLLGVFGLIGIWLHNRGKQELAHVTGASPARIDELATLVADRIPKAPQSPLDPGRGAPAAPGAPPKT